jgi:hypothetical protein
MIDNGADPTAIAMAMATSAMTSISGPRATAAYLRDLAEKNGSEVN